MTSSSERRSAAVARVVDSPSSGIPFDRPEGYHAVPGGKPGKLGRWLKGMLPPRHRVGGLCQADGMPHDFQRARSSMISGGSKASHSGTPPHGPGARARIGRDWP